MKLLWHLLSAALILSITGCPPRPDPNFFTGNCPFERINWMKVTTTYDRTKLANIAGKLGAAASSDSAALKKLISGRADVNFQDSLSKTIREITKDSVEVSKEFYEEYLKRRETVCELWTFVKDKDFKKDKVFIQKLEDQYFEIKKNFGKIQEKEKKSPN